MEKPREKGIKELILSRASNIFKRFGFKKTTMEDIAGSLNKAKGSLYYYFKNKEDIFRSIVEKEKSQLDDELAPILQGKLEPKDKLVRYFQKRIEFLDKLPNYYSALKDKHLEHYSFVADLREKSREEEIKSIRNILNEGIKAGTFRKLDPDKLAINIVSSMKYLEERAVSRENIKEIETDLEIMLDIILHGLVARN